MLPPDPVNGMGVRTKWFYELKAHQVKFTTHAQAGYVGRCTYHLRGPDEVTTPEMPLTVRQQIWLLSQLAFYCGVGYKTSMGMGQARSVGRTVEQL